MNVLTLSQARNAWHMLPAHFKFALDTLEKSGRLEEARPDVLADAERRLRAIGPKFSNLDACLVLDLAAEQWLKQHPA
jgi:hypothetical protein